MIWPALGILVLHYLWVIRAKVAFEEASLTLAQRRAEHLASVRQGQLGPWKRKRRRDPYILPFGIPLVASRTFAVACGKCRRHGD